MVSINPYLTFNGNCEEAFNFYKSVFGGEFEYIGRFKDMPPQEGMPPVSESEGNKLMHISLALGGGTMLMGSDTFAMSEDVTFGENITMSLNAVSREEADTVFKSLSDEGIITMPLGQTFWGSYFGMCTDKFGINWMISFSEDQK